MPTLDYNDLHDSELRALDTPVTKRLLRDRGVAAREIRIAVARVYGRGDMMTSAHWQVLPYLTDRGTIGVVDVARGTAWDTTIPAPPEVAALGVEPGVYAGANNASGDVRLDGELVQRDGASPGAPLAAPAGWQQIALPTWRGYDPEARSYTDVPPEEFRPDRQVRPRLVQAGLMTCYGEPGAESAGEFLSVANGWEAAWPWGVPDWVEGESISVIDTMIDAGGGRRTRRPRGPEHVEEDWAAAATLVARRATARMLRARASRRTTTEEQGAILQAAERLEEGEPARDVLVQARPALTSAGNRTNGMSDRGATGALRALAAAEEATCAWSAAMALGCSAELTAAVREALA